LAPSNVDHNIAVLFFGGPDDRLALMQLVQLCQSNPNLSATVVWITKSEDDLEDSEHSATIDTIAKEKGLAHQNFTITSIGAGFPDTVYGQPTTETRMTSHTADHVLWSRVTSTKSERITFAQLQSSRPLSAAMAYLTDEVIQRQFPVSLSPSSPNTPSKGIIVAAGRARRMAVESHETELRELARRAGAQSTSELRKTVGDVGSAFIISTSHQLLVFQASSPSQSSEV